MLDKLLKDLESYTDAGHKKKIKIIEIVFKLIHVAFCLIAIILIWNYLIAGLIHVRQIGIIDAFFLRMFVFNIIANPQNDFDKWIESMKK